MSEHSDKTQNKQSTVLAWFHSLVLTTAGLRILLNKH